MWWHPLQNVFSAYDSELPLSESVHFEKRYDELNARIDEDGLETVSGDGPVGESRSSRDEIVRWQLLMLLVDPELGVLGQIGASGREDVLRVARLYARWLRGEDVDDREFEAISDELEPDEDEDGNGDADTAQTPNASAENLEWADAEPPSEDADEDRSYARERAAEAACFSGGMLVMFELLSYRVARRNPPGIPHWAKADFAGDNLYERIIYGFADALWHVYRRIRRNPIGKLDHIRAQAGFLLRLMQLRWNPETVRERQLFRRLMAGDLSGFDEYAELLRANFVEPDEISEARETFERLVVLRSRVPLEARPNPEGETEDGIGIDASEAPILGRTYARSGDRRLEPDVLEEHELEERFSPQVIDRARAAPPERSLNQRILYGLLAETFKYHRTTWFDVVPTAIAYAIVAALMVLFGFACIATAHNLTHWLIGSWSDVAQYAVLLLGLIVVLALRLFHDDTEVDFKRFPAERIDLGRMEHAFDFAIFAMVLCSVFGMQWALLQYSHDHLGLLPEANLEDSGWIALDNVLAACLFDVYEMYELERRPVTHGTWSASVFLVFRTSYNVLFLLTLYNFWQRWRCGVLMRRFPSGKLPYGRFAGWLSRETKAPGRWAVLLLDEAVFLRIAAAYLRDDFDEVRRISSRFPRIRVEEDLRAIFVDERGEPLFEGFGTT